MLKGWNTFDVTSISTQVLLTEDLALNLQINDTVSGDSLGLMFTRNRVKGSERVRTLAHTPDGSYADFIVHWRDFGMRVQTHANDDDLYVLVTPTDSTANPGIIRLKCYMLYGREEEMSLVEGKIIAELSGKRIIVAPAAETLEITDKPVLKFSIDHQIAYSTASADLQNIKELITKAEK